VSAALLQQEGYEVVGVFIRIVVPGYPCTAGQDKIDAMRVAAHLKIPFIEVDLSEEYKKRVFDASIKEFARGATPNPDVLCNREIKFGLFYDFAKSRGADFVATGHYAQLRTKQKQVSLLQGADHDKDQSYFLWAVPETHLRYTLFPVGGLQKSQVRELAESFGLPNAKRKDSQGLCFLGPISMDEMLHRELKPTAGEVLSESGEVIGTHGGAALYTLGERRGFVLKPFHGEAVPYYVVGKDMAANTITVSAHKFPQDAKQTKVRMADTNWIGEVAPGACMARYRYRQKLIPAEIVDKHTVSLLEPHYVPEGQSLVLYVGQRCLGGGVVDKVKLY
jgi:tRNA-specific 2-thiouridylase